MIAHVEDAQGGRFPATATVAEPAPATGAIWRQARLASAIRKLLDGIDLIGRIVVVAALVGELLVVMTDLTIRFLFTQSLLWTEEASRLCLTTLAFVGGALAYRARHHTAIKVVTRLFPAAIQSGITAAVDAVILCVVAITLYVSFQLFDVATMSLTPILQISGAWIVLPFNVGLALIALFATERLAFDHPEQVTRVVVPIVVALAILLAWIGLAEVPRPDSPTALTIMLPLFLATVLLGLPVSFAMLLGSIFFLQITDSAPMIAVAQNTVDGTGHFILLTLPFFIWAGLIMEKGGISLRLVRFAMALVGHLRGGLLQVAVVTIYLVSGISGSKVADVVAVGTVLRRELTRQGYPAKEGAAVLSAAGAMSETIPPSIAMLVLGSVTPISIGTLFIAGLLPAAVIALFLMVAIYALAWRRDTPRAPRASLAELIKSSAGAILPLIMPTMMIVGIKFGFATPTEVSAVAVVYGLILSMVIYRSIGIGSFFAIAADCGLLAGMVLFIIGTAGAFAWTLTAANLPAVLVKMLHVGGDSPALFLIGSMVLLIVIGSLLEGLPALIILGPLLMPLANQLGIDSIHYAMVILLAMGIGIFIPPIGICFYVSCAVMECEVEAAAKTMLPYLAVLLAGVLAVAFVPWFTHAVPNLVGAN